MTGVEDTIHFLLKCPLYATHREVLMSYVNEILIRNNIYIDDYVSLYLYGNNLLNSTDNQNIILATISF